MSLGIQRMRVGNKETPAAGSLSGARLPGEAGRAGDISLGRHHERDFTIGLRAERHRKAMEETIEE